MILTITQTGLAQPGITVSPNVSVTLAVSPTPVTQAVFNGMIAAYLAALPTTQPATGNAWLDGGVFSVA